MKADAKTEATVMKLTPDSEKLLVDLVTEFKKAFHRSLYDGWRGSFAGVISGLLPEHGNYRSDVCTEGNCHRVRWSLRELAGLGFIILVVANVRPVELNGAWQWLFQSEVFLTLVGIRYVEKLNYPWYRKWWDNIPSDLRALIIALIITVLGVIVNNLLR